MFLILVMLFDLTFLFSHRPPVSPPAPAPIFVEAPPSSDDEDDLEFRVVVDSRFLNG
jgi:hypothetical protein